MLNPVTEDDIRWLFDDVWPMMDRSAVHRDACLEQIDKINRRIEAHDDDRDDALETLLRLSGVGVVIGTGLLFAGNRDLCVPFDKFTTGFAVQLELLESYQISDGRYAGASDRVRDHVDSSDDYASILEFVRTARGGTDFPIAPK